MTTLREQFGLKGSCLALALVLVALGSARPETLKGNSDRSPSVKQREGDLRESAYSKESSEKSTEDAVKYKKSDAATANIGTGMGGCPCHDVNCCASTIRPESPKRPQR